MESLGAKGFEQAITAADTKDEVPEPLKSGALEWFASLAAPTCLRPAARFAAKEKTHGSSRKQKTVQEARDDSDVDDDVESVANGYGSLGSDKVVVSYPRRMRTRDRARVSRRSALKL